MHTNSAVSDVSSTTIQKFYKNETIPPWKTMMWQIEEGTVKTSTLAEDGNVIILGYWCPGEVVGHVLSNIQPYFIECLTDVEMSLLPSTMWGQAADKIIQHQHQTLKLLTIVQQEPLSYRLWLLLLWLDDKFGCNVNQGRLIRLKVTHQSLADTIHSTRVSVTRTLKQFEAEGKLIKKGHQIFLSSRSD